LRRGDLQVSALKTSRRAPYLGDRKTVNSKKYLFVQEKQHNI